MALVIVDAVGEVHAHLAPGRSMVRVVNVRDDTVLLLPVCSNRDVIPHRRGLALIVSE